MLVVKPNKEGLALAVKILRAGGVIVFSTDTAYGLGGIFNSAKVVRRVLQIKNRRDRKFTLVASDLAQVRNFFKLNKEQWQLARRYWPGPLSLVVSSRYSVRVPKSKISQNLAKKVDKPLIATSANLAGNHNLYSAKRVVKEFAGREHQPDLVIDVGILPRRRPSTLVKVNRRGVEILRQGPIKILTSK